jgi:hypothetical protein
VPVPGGRPNAESITKSDVEDLVDWILTAGRRRGGRPGTGLSGRSARLTLGRLSAALEAAVLEGKLVRNVARLVKPPEQARVLVEYRVRIEEPKSRNGKRTLPLDGELAAALTALRKRQLEESTIAGAAYRSGLAELGWYQGGEYVITDAAGTPVHPEWYSDEFGRLLRRAGLRRITLHDSRHTTLTLMEHAGVPISIISKWAGHYDSAFTQKTYVHASEEDLQRGLAALARIHKIG